MCIFEHFNLFASFVGNFIQKTGNVIFAFVPKFSETLTQNLTTPNSFFEKMPLMKILLKLKFSNKKVMSKKISWQLMSMICPNVQLLQTDLNTIYEWSNANSAKLNADKFECLWYGNNLHIEATTSYYSKGDTVIEGKDSFRI